MNGTPTRLRQATEEDVPAVTRLVHAAYAEHAAAGLNFTAVDQSDSTTRLRLFTGQSWVIECDGELLATATASIPPGRHIQQLASLAREPHVAWLNQLAVHPAHRGEGLGRRLLDTVVTISRKQDAHTLGLDTAAPASRLRALYEHWGFVDRETIHWPGKAYDSIVMMRALPVQGERIEARGR